MCEKSGDIGTANRIEETVEALQNGHPRLGAEVKKKNKKKKTGSIYTHSGAKKRSGGEK